MAPEMAAIEAELDALWKKRKRGLKAITRLDPVTSTVSPDSTSSASNMSPSVARTNLALALAVAGRLSVGRGSG